MAHEDQEYLSFTLAGEHFATPLVRVQEIFQMQDIVPAPGDSADSHVLGTMRINEKVFPVVDMRRVVNVSSPERSSDACIIVFNNNGVEVGALVDQVESIIKIASQDIRAIHEFDSPIYGQGQTAHDFRNFKLVNSDEILKKIDLVRIGIAC